MKLPPRSETCLKLNRAGGKLISVLVPHHRNTEFEFERCLDAMVEESRGMNLFIEQSFKDNTNLEEARHELILERGLGDYVLFIDSDQTFPADSLGRLIRWNRPLVAGLYIQRLSPHLPVAGYGNPDQGYCKLLAWPPNALLEVDFVGFGLVLIKREALEAMPDINPFLRLRSKVTGGLIGEDMSFCYHFKEAGFPVLLDTSILVGHSGKFVWHPQNYLTNFQRTAVAGSSESPFFGKAVAPVVAGWPPGMEPKKEEIPVES